MRFEKYSSVPSLINTICIIVVLIVITVFRAVDATESQRRWEMVVSFIDKYESMHSCHPK